MEDENDLMALFNQNNGMEIEMSGPFIGDEDNEEDDISLGDDEINEEDDNDNKAVDGEDQENVDGDDDDTEEGDGASDSSPNLFSSVADVLLEQGFLPSLESSKDIKTADDFSAALNNEVLTQARAMADEYLSKMDTDSFAKSSKEIKELDAMDESYLKSNLDIAKDIIFQDYMNQGLSEDRARKMLRKTIDLGEDMILEEALESKQSLQEFNIKKQEFAKKAASDSLEQERREQVELEQKVKQMVFESKELIKGLPVTKALQDRVYKSMTEVVSKNPNTGELENKFMKDRNVNQVEFDIRMYQLYEMTNGFRDLSLISKQVASKATLNLEKVMRQTKSDDSGLPGYAQDSQSYSSPFGSELVF